MSESHYSGGRVRFLIALGLCGTGVILGVAGYQAEMGHGMYLSAASAAFSLAGIYAMIRSLVLWK